MMKSYASKRRCVAWARWVAALGVLSVAGFAQVIPGYDVDLPLSRVTVIDWSGQPALLIWGSNQHSNYAAGFRGAPIGVSHVALDVRLALVSDSRACAVGAQMSASPGNSSAGGFVMMSVPAGGFGMSPPQQGPVSIVDCTRIPRGCSSVTLPLYWHIDYCPWGVWCGGCNGGAHDGPEFWALVCTVRLV